MMDAGIRPPRSSGPVRPEGGLRRNGIAGSKGGGKPLISVVTIVYNGERHLEQTIRSVVGQSYGNIEYILVDGGSTDGTLDIIRKYEDRIDYWISEPDRGISDAMNKGTRLATGDIVAHLHADDYYPDESVVSSVHGAFVDHKEAGWLTGGMYLVNTAGDRTAEIRVRKYSYDRLKKANIILHPATFVRREAFEKVGAFDLSYRYAMDYDLWLRLGAMGDPILLDMPLACFRTHRNSLSMKNIGAAIEEEWTIRNKSLAGHPIRRLAGYMRYKANRFMNTMYVKNLLRREGLE